MKLGTLPTRAVCLCLSWAFTLGSPVGKATESAAPVSAVTEAVAANESEQLGAIVVFGRGEKMIGKADAASEGTVGGADLAVRPLLRVAELLEVVPGLIAAQHSGSGKANQYFLRGFNLDHGTDFTSYVDDVPWNLRSHGHGQGYLDVNGLIPEVVQRIDYRKGPYRADIGDFSMAGASFLTTIDGLARPFVAVEGGGYGWGRLAGGGSTSLGEGTLTLVGQYKTYDGPWELKENLQHGSMWGKYTQLTNFGTLNVSLSGYHASWHPTEQAPEASFGTSACANQYCSLDTTAYGKTDRWIASAQLLSDSWRASGYAQVYDWHMLSDPTYDYQIDQFDHRWTVGGRFEHSLVKSAAIELKAGTEMRYDHIAKVGLNHTVAGVYQSNISDNSIKEGSIGAYGEATWTPIEDLRLMGGLRANGYNFDVTALSAGSAAGNKNDYQVSPKVGVAYSLNRHVELYGNWGQGFHSNDARGVVNKDTSVPGLVRGTGYEAGARFEVGNFKITAAYWWLDLASELVFSGDSNAVEPKGASKRQGYELVAFWRPVDWLGIDGVYTGSHAHYVSIQQDPDYDALTAPNLVGRNIEDSVKSAGELGFSAVRGAWEASARLRYLGPYPLVPSGTKTADAEKMVNLRAAYKLTHWTIYAEVLNVLNDQGKDIEYYYQSYVPGVSAAGTEQVTRLSRAEEPRTVRWGLKYEF
ncbi:MAG: TonB-dependent receptor [Pseudomonadota bacterium]|nr:TonB-dependent receptor [Pseudomonadota bacterium]